MPIKKSAFILLIFASFSACLLVFASYQCDNANNKPGKKVPLKCCRECSGVKTSSPWNIASYTMLPLEG
jgi:hypothetical protein